MGRKKLSKEERLRRDMEAQVKEALELINRDNTKLIVGHEPSDDECVMHYTTSGGSENWRKHHPRRRW